MTAQDSENKASGQSASPPPMGGRTSAPAVRRAQQLTIPPPGLDELEETYLERPDGAFAPEQALEEQIAELENWARASVRKERLEMMRFWLLRGLMFIGAIAAGACGGLSLQRLSIIFAAVAALAVAVDSAWPSAADRNVRRRAIRDLRELQHTLRLKWDKVRLAHPNPQAPKRIAHALVLLDTAQAKREEIGKYLGEASPGVTKSLGS